MKFRAFRSGRLRVRSAAAAAALASVLVGLLGAATPAIAGWEPAMTIDNSGSGFSSSGSGAVAVGTNGLATALFLQRSSTTPSGKPGDPFLARRPAGDVSWSAPSLVATPSGNVNTNPISLAAGSDGGTLGTFVFDPAAGNSQTLATRWVAGAAGPGAAVQVPCTTGASPECSDSTPQVALDGAGNGYMVGATERGFNGDVLFARTDPVSGAWQAAEVVAQGFNPKLAVDGGGDVVITYLRTNTSTPTLSVNHLYAKRELAGEIVFAPEQQISGPNTVDVNGTAVVIDGAGDATAVFPEDTVPPTGPVPNAPVIDAVRWARTNAGPDAEQALSSTSDGRARAAVAAVDPQGQVVAAWVASTSSSAIFAAEHTASGWSASQHVSPPDNRTADTPQVAVDADGTATVVYIDSVPPTGSDVDVKASRRGAGDSEDWSPVVSLRFSGTGAGTVQPSAPGVAAARAKQADAIFVQQLDGVTRLFATRFSVADGYPRPKGATPLRVALVPAFRQCTSPNEGHGGPLAAGSCAPPAQQSSYLTVGTFDSNGKPANSVGFVRLDVKPGDPSTTANEADVGINTSLTDVRNRSDLSDYTGELRSVLTLRITDRRNGSSGIDPATVSDLLFPFTVPCSATPEDAGAKCAVSTTANTLVPGAVTESKRSIWQLGQIEVYDGGADGSSSTADGDSVFARQGVFVP